MYLLARKSLAFSKVSRGFCHGSTGNSLRSHPKVASPIRRLVERLAEKTPKTINGRPSPNVRYYSIAFFPFIPSVYSFSRYTDSTSFEPLRCKPIREVGYSTRGTLVQFLYKLWDLIRFLLSLSKFVLLFSPFLFTYPVTFLSANIDDLWWVLFKKAIEFSGPITVEFAKWLGTREDLFLHKTCLHLLSVSHRKSSHSWYSTKKKLRRALGKEWSNTLVKFDPPRKEIANSELAQVYKASIPLDACSDQIADEIVKDVDDFEGLEEPFLSDGIEVVGLGKWLSEDDEDDIVDDAFGSWMLTKQGLAQSDSDQGIRSCPIFIPPMPEVELDASAPPSVAANLKLRERIRDRVHDIQRASAEKVVGTFYTGLNACVKAIERSYDLMAKVGTMRQELQIVPDPFDLTPAIPPKPDKLLVDDHKDKLYLEDLLQDTLDFVTIHNNDGNDNVNNNVNNNNNDNFNHEDKINNNKDDSNNDGDRSSLEESSTIPFDDDLQHRNISSTEEDSKGTAAGEEAASVSDVFISAMPSLVPETILEKVEAINVLSEEEIREWIPELTPEEIAIDVLVESPKESQPHIPESVSEGMEALFQMGADAVIAAKDGVKEGVAQIKESVAPFGNMDQSPAFDEPKIEEDSVLLKFHPGECQCRICQNLVPVAVKVIHPGIVRQTIRDLAILRLLASVLDFLPGLSWWQPATCVDEFGDRLHRMINLKREAIALERFNINFSTNPNIRFPRPMRPFVKRDVMVEMWEESDNIKYYLMSDSGEGTDDDASSLPFSLRSSLADIISQALVKMIFEDNYVHCDINEDNVLVQNGRYFVEHPPDKERLIQVEVMDTIVIVTEEVKNPLRLILCDADVASHISNPDAFVNIFNGIFNRDPNLSATGFDSFISDSSRTKDLSHFKEELKKCFNRHLASEDLNIIPDLTLFIEDIYRVVYWNKVKMEDDFVAVLTSMLAVDKIGKKLIGGKQNLFSNIYKHFATQFDKECS